MSDFFKTLSICMEKKKHSEKGVGVGVLVTSLSGFGLKTLMAMGSRK